MVRNRTGERRRLPLELELAIAYACRDQDREETFQIAGMFFFFPRGIHLSEAANEAALPPQTLQAIGPRLDGLPSQNSAWLPSTGMLL